ncbi:cbb3-type cytochrome c oxidase subunit II [Akkermansiaceae bacterium]|nr:cbb3-type cytochrome c oxidase subunit II [Akkermansiaceae bacterium]
MAVAGVAAGFLAAWRGVRPEMIRAALVVAGVAALVAAFNGMLTILLVIALATGAALGVATVSLAALLPGWCGIGAVALGTGMGYAVCNLPWVFPQSPAHQAWIAAAIAGIGALAVPPAGDWRVATSKRPLAFPLVLLLFTALVWMDSAAFFIIQHEGDLKSATWGSSLLWRNAALHLGFALLAGLLLSRGKTRGVPIAAWVMLAVAALWVNDASTRWAAGWLYPSAVSLYSVALVVWPGWFCGAVDSKSASWKAAWLFAVAGWFGSANGIGMAQTLRYVPTSFIVVSALVVMMVLSLGSGRRFFRPAMVAGIVIICGWIMGKPAGKSAESAVERGRQVYISEGCIHCHSQYSRPGSVDETIWGTAAQAEMTLKQQPVLIGNRRQGPDLTNIGARRSDAWLKAHFIDPRALSPDSAMPSYAHLFQDSRGDDLVSYLRQCGIESIPDLLARQAAWLPDRKNSMPADGKRLFARHCAVCHGDDGAGQGMLAGQLPVPPINLRDGPFIRTQDGKEETIARIIKFGVIGSQMPGHETLGDGEMIALTDYVRELRTK